MSDTWISVLLNNSQTRTRYILLTDKYITYTYLHEATFFLRSSKSFILSTNSLSFKASDAVISPLNPIHPFILFFALRQSIIPGVQLKSGPYGPYFNTSNLFTHFLLALAF